MGFYVYALTDPLTGETRYVGQTRRPLHKRYQGHLTEPNDTYKCRWLKQLLKLGLKPGITQLFECFDHKTLDDAEIYFIQFFKDRGHRLTNHTTGGNSAVAICDAATRAKISAKRVGIPKSAEHREKLRLANLGKKLSDTTKAKIAKAQLGKAKKPEAIAKTAAALEAYRQTVRDTIRKRIRINLRTRNKNYGVKFSEERRLNISKGKQAARRLKLENAKNE